MFTQLNPPIPVYSSHGPALAYGVIDYGPDHDLLWVCFTRSNGVWCLRNEAITPVENESLDRPKCQINPSA
jgi:hypothetical protein